MTETMFLNPKAAREAGRWYVVDAENQVLGRLATGIASLIRGKCDPTFTPHTGSGHHVIVIRADRVRVTGNKMTTKVYKRYSGYPGGQRTRTLEQQLAIKPTEVIRHAVRGMLPKTKLGRRLATQLHVYAGDEHPHAPQQPAPIRMTEHGPEGLQA
jgi:large subunit ribosomal protein L13